MDVNEEIVALKKENQMYKEYYDRINAEKVALDELLVENLKSSLNSKVNAGLDREKAKKLEVDLSVLRQEKSALQSEKNILEQEIIKLKSQLIDKELSVVLDNAS